MLQGSVYLQCALKCNSNSAIQIDCPSSPGGNDRSVRLHSEARGLTFEHTGEFKSSLLFALYPAVDLYGDWNVTLVLTANDEYTAAAGYELECHQQSARWLTIHPPHRALQCDVLCMIVAVYFGW